MAANHSRALFMDVWYGHLPLKVGGRCFVYEECCRQMCSPLFQPCGCKTWQPAGMVEMVGETGPMVRLFCVGFTSPILSTGFWVILAGPTNGITSLGAWKYYHVSPRSPVITLPLSGSLCCWSKWFESSKFWCKKHLPPQILPGLGLPHVLVALLLLRPAGFGHVISYFDDVWLLDNITMNSKCLT